MILIEVLFVGLLYWDKCSHYQRYGMQFCFDSDYTMYILEQDVYNG